MTNLPAMPFGGLAHRLLKWSVAIPAALLSLRGSAIAAGAAPAEKLVNVADTRALAPGISKWIADIYNTSYLSFGLLVVVTMALMGLVLGICCDRLVGLLGLDLGRMQHHE
jgi:hypothetical protein